MQPPAGENIVITPLANCWKEGELICIDNLNCDRNINNVALHYKILSEAFPDDKGCWLKVFPECEPFPFAVRELAATMVPVKCAKMAIVAPKSTVSALNLSYSLVKGKGVQLEFFQEEKEARRWLYIRC